MARPPKRIGLSQVEIVSPELRKALGITRPRNVKEAQEMGSRPTGLGTLFFPESKIQSAQARTIMGGSPLSGGISPGFAQAVTGSPTGLDQNAQTTLMDLAGMLPTPRPTDLMKQQQLQTQQDDFSQLNQAKVINDKLRGFEEDIVEVDKSNRQNIIGPEEDVVQIQEEADQTEKENLTNAQKATKSALQEFLKASGKETGPKEFKDYINEFGEATGLDISGDPDTKQALMSFGLALMQNRAGKGFNLSNILSSVGEAGEAAMPDFRKAVAEAKAIRAKAGSYALGKTEEDKKQAMNRQGYVVIPKEGGMANAILQGTGRFARLNSYELNSLDNNADFNDRFTIVDANSYNSMTKELVKAQNKGKEKDKKIYLEKPRSVPLFSGSKVTFDVFYANPNNPTGAKDRIVNPEMALNAIETMEKGLTRRVDKFRDIAKVINQTGVALPQQARSFAVQLSKSFGVPLSKETDPLKQLNSLLTELKARNAAEILGESGKTISDNDRRLVDTIVGGIDIIRGDADIDLLKSKLSRLFKQITASKQDEIDEAYSNLEKFGIKVDREGAGTLGTNMVLGEDNVYRFVAKETT